MRYILIILCALTAMPGFAQEKKIGSLGIRYSLPKARMDSLLLSSDSTATISSKALVDMQSTTRGVLLPRMTTTQRNAISGPATSLLIYNTTVDSFQYYASGAWQNFGAGGSSLTLAAVGSSPNANGATYSSGTFTLQPASGSFPGVVTTGSQAFAGVKTFNSIPIVGTAAAHDSSAGAASTRYVDRAIGDLTSALESVFVKEVTTTDDTPVNIDTIDIAPGEVVTVEVQLDGVKDNGHVAVVAKKKRSFLLDDASSLKNGTLISSEPEAYIPSGSGLSTAAFTITNTGDLAIIQFTGEASTTILAKFTYTVTRKAVPL